MSCQSSHSFVSSMHVGSRVFAGASFLLTAAVNQTAVIALIQLSIFITLLGCLPRGGTLILKSFQLLCWLAIPILLLHAFFTPGELIALDITIPVSVEGVKSGLWLSLHLTVIFFSAVLFSKLLSYREWLGFVVRIPVAGRRLAPYALLQETIREKVRCLLQDEFSEWRRQGKSFRGFMMHLQLLLLKGLQQSRLYANELWLDWDHHVATMLAPATDRKVSAVATLLALASGVFAWYGPLMAGV